MTAQEALTQVLAERIPDERVCFSDLVVQGGVLEGKATPDFETLLYTFAREHKLALRVTFSEPSVQKISASRAFLRAEPKADAEVVSEALYGEAMAIYDRKGDFVLASREKDKYLGWLSLASLSHHLPAPSHWLRVPRAHVFAKPSVRAPLLFELSLRVNVHVVSSHEGWSEILLPQGAKGYVKTTLIASLSATAKASANAITMLAARFIDSPYVWGGVSAWGLDCSGFVQTIFGTYNIHLPRDTDQQAQEGKAVTDVQTADLLFFPGHVAIALSPSKIIHANAKHMRVSIDDKNKSDYAKELWENITTIRRFVD